MNDVQIAEIREIFTLFDKNSDGYVNTSELGTILRALNMNPTQSEVKEKEHEVDPNDTGSFDQMNLISLIARHPKPIDTLDSMIEAIKLLASDESSEEKQQKPKIAKSKLEYYICGQGEKMERHEFDELLLQCSDLISNTDDILIEDLANFLMSR